jgi:leucine efflux protein
MYGVADYGAFVVAVVVFLAIPGPGNLALITSTGKGGFKGGLAASLGVIAGDQVLMWLAVAGVAALLAAWPVVFGAVQWLGAAYLAWLGLCWPPGRWCSVPCNGWALPTWPGWV